MSSDNVLDGFIAFAVNLASNKGQNTNKYIFFDSRKEELKLKEQNYNYGFSGNEPDQTILQRIRNIKVPFKFKNADEHNTTYDSDGKDKSLENISVKTAYLNFQECKYFQ